MIVHFVFCRSADALGGFALFLSSLAIAIPYLRAAFFLSRALPHLSSLQKAAAGVGLVSSVVLAIFGMILITDPFHIPSNLLYRLYLGLSCSLTFGPGDRRTARRRARSGTDAAQTSGSFRTEEFTRALGC